LPVPPPRENKPKELKAKAVARPRALPGPGHEMSPRQLVSVRVLFWDNVVREVLGGLAMAGQREPGLMDGRFAVLTHGGERIPIARVEPVFSYSVCGTRADRQTSEAIQLTVFRVTTPDGEVFTLPVREVRGFHELTPELLGRLQKEEDDEQKSSRDPAPRPFGLAAFAALPKAPMWTVPPPMDPME
jgi:hypothetical protein